MASIAGRKTALPSVARDDARPGERTDSIPWYIWCAVLAVTSATVGANWDISWHMSIGRDTFWTPAHMAIYLCGVLAGLAVGYIILSTSFSRSSPLSAASVHIWGFRAPLGAFIASWGGITMLVSAPFDNWWHDAYGLDVKIISPPHIVLFLGVYGVLLGTIVLIAGHMNRSSGIVRRHSQLLLLYSCGIMLVMLMTMLMEYLERIFLHTSQPYLVLAIFAPIMLTVAARATDLPFAATFVAGFYTLFNIGLVLILPLFPAEPKLGPVYQHFTHFIPEPFPILLIVPALALDLLWRSRTTDSQPAPKSAEVPAFIGWRGFVACALLWRSRTADSQPAPKSAEVPAFIGWRGFVACALLWRSRTADSQWQRTRSWNLWKLAAISAAVFVLFLVAAEWPFASFLMSAAARNRFFGTMYFWYGLPPTSHSARYLFWDQESTGHFWRGMALALVFGTVSFRWGLSRGEWLRKLKR